ncbi:hypothetical protein ABIB25_002142 [Nakamurella sp. UYEF19]|uniref:ASCH domain-containing protein n=1 Tax=Nakamurella sp. UYEF19 TaxID=1756392 RepID=UPI0033964262
MSGFVIFTLVSRIVSTTGRRGKSLLLPNVVLQGIVEGSVTHVYRRWDTPRAKPGGSQLTKFGVVAIDGVREVELGDISEADARACGEKDLAGLTKWLGKRPDDRIFEVTLHYAGPDPRLALRADLPDEDELVRIDSALARMDAGKPSGPWTHFILTWIQDNPAVVSKVLATLLDRELQPMKTDIRKMKALGLTISLEVGYRLSPRGEAYLNWSATRRRG